MKRVTLLLCLVAGLLSANADEPEFSYDMKIAFMCRIVNPEGMGNQIPRTPIQPPTVYLCDHTLYICSDGRDFDLQVVASDETVVYSTYVPSSTTEVQLPSTLSGDYHLQLFNGEYVFIGEIAL